MMDIDINGYNLPMGLDTVVLSAFQHFEDKFNMPVTEIIQDNLITHLVNYTKTKEWYAKTKNYPSDILNAYLKLSLASTLLDAKTVIVYEKLFNLKMVEHTVVSPLYYAAVGLRDIQLCNILLEMGAPLTIQETRSIIFHLSFVNNKELLNLFVGQLNYNNFKINTEILTNNFFKNCRVDYNFAILNTSFMFGQSDLLAVMLKHNHFLFESDKKIFGNFNFLQFIVRTTLKNSQMSKPFCQIVDYLLSYQYSSELWSAKDDQGHKVIESICHSDNVPAREFLLNKIFNYINDITFLSQSKHKDILDNPEKTGNIPKRSRS